MAVLVVFALSLPRPQYDSDSEDVCSKMIAVVAVVVVDDDDDDGASQLALIATQIRLARSNREARPLFRIEL